MLSFFRRKKVTLDEQLAKLAECGVGLRSPEAVAQLVESWGAEAFEREPWLMALVAMGCEEEREPFEPLSDDIWHFDTECIEDHGDYARIAARMRDLAGGDLPIEDITDYVDVEEGEAWLSVTLDGASIRWEAEVSDDWVDPSIMTKIACLLADLKTGKRFTYLSLEGQDILIGCATKEQFKALRKTTRLRFQWMV